MVLVSVVAGDSSTVIKVPFLSFKDKETHDEETGHVFTFWGKLVADDLHADQFPFTFFHNEAEQSNTSFF